MTRHRRSNVELLAVTESTSIAGTLGRELRTTRKRRQLTQAQLGKRVGLSSARIGELERGDGASAPLEVWIRLGIALERPLAVSFSRDIRLASPRDAGHLAAQEYVLRLARRHGRRADFELRTRPADPARSIDVALRDDGARALMVIEIWNRLDDIGAGARSTSRKVADLDGPAVLAAGNGSPYRVAACWLLVDTAANRRLVANYQETFRTRFPGSSLAWVRCLTEGLPPPTEAGVAWIDPRSSRIVPIRWRRG